MSHTINKPFPEGTRVCIVYPGTTTPVLSRYHNTIQILYVLRYDPTHQSYWLMVPYWPDGTENAVAWSFTSPTSLTSNEIMIMPTDESPESPVPTREDFDAAHQRLLKRWKHLLGPGNKYAPAHRRVTS